METSFFNELNSLIPPMYLSEILKDFVKGSKTNLSSPVLSRISLTTYLVISNFSCIFKFKLINGYFVPSNSGLYLSSFKHYLVHSNKISRPFSVTLPLFSL